MKSEDFLELYRQLEDSLDERYSGKKRRYSSVMLEYLNDRESAPFREKLDLCREIRNLLTHNAKIEGQDIVKPADAVGQFLQEALDYIRRPPLALQFATKGDEILHAGINQTVLKIMGIMEKAGYSHIPILENGKFVGVFSVGTVFSYVLTGHDKPITRQTTIAELRSLLPIHMHGENYEFASQELTSVQARQKFERYSGKNQRLSVIFITKNGSQEERLLGMLTPWDIMGDKHSFVD